jgi:hypothetical protein
MNDGELIVNAAPGLTAPTLAATIDGGVELTATAQVILQRPNRPPQPPRPPNWHSLVEVQALPSPLRIGNQVIARSVTDQLHGQAVEEDNRERHVYVSLLWRMSMPELLAFEATRAGKAAEFETTLKLAVRTYRNAQTADFPIKFRVAASDWADLLSQHGTTKVMHIDLPLGATTDLTTNAHLRNEINRAQRLYSTGDYSGCIGVVRDVWDPILKEMVPSGRWDAILKASLPPEIARLMDGYADALRTIVNKGHHRGISTPEGEAALYEFTQRDAEFVLEAALTFLRYLGRLARP